MGRGWCEILAGGMKKNPPFYFRTGFRAASSAIFSGFPAMACYFLYLRRPVIRENIIQQIQNQY
jgi:hypothetical protein